MKVYDSDKDVLYNILIEYWVPIKMCLNEAYNKDHIDKHLSDNFPIQNNL
jgi:hypothetical protein